MPPSMTADKNDVAINEVALQQAATQSATRSLFRDFLGGPGCEVVSDDADVQGANVEPEPEVYGGDLDGLGYAPPLQSAQSDSQAREASGATELLRRQMLGNRAVKQHKASVIGRVEARKGQRPQPPQPRTKKARNENAGEDEEDGRSTLGKKNNTAASARIRVKSPEDEDNQKTVIPQQPAAAPVTLSKNPRRGSSYLDQVFAERAAKKKKKRRDPED